MKSISGNKDIDREILLKLSNKDFLYIGYLNKYFKNEVCDDLFFKRRLQQTYPYILKFKNKNKTWKRYFLEVAYYINEIKKDFKYLENSKIRIRIRYTAIKNDFSMKDLLMIGIKNSDLSQFAEAIKRKTGIQKNDWDLVIINKENHGLEYVGQNGAKYLF